MYVKKDEITNPDSIKQKHIEKTAEAALKENIENVIQQLQNFIDQQKVIGELTDKQAIKTAEGKIINVLNNKDKVACQSLLAKISQAGEKIIIKETSIAPTISSNPSYLVEALGISLDSMPKLPPKILALPPALDDSQPLLPVNRMSDNLITLGFFASECINPKPIKLVFDDFTQSLKKERERKASANLHFIKQRSSLEEALVNVLGEKYTRGNWENQKRYKDFFCAIVNGEVNDSLGKTFNTYVKITDPQERADHMEDLMKEYERGLFVPRARQYK